jgi:hypothetical protein
LIDLSFFQKQVKNHAVIPLAIDKAFHDLIPEKGSYFPKQVERKYHTGIVRSSVRNNVNDGRVFKHGYEFGILQQFGLSKIIKDCRIVNRRNTGGLGSGVFGINRYEIEGSVIGFPISALKTGGRRGLLKDFWGVVCCLFTRSFYFLKYPERQESNILGNPLCAPIRRGEKTW